MLRRAHAVQPVAAVQNGYSLWWRAVETNGILAACDELGTGFLTGAMGKGTKLATNDFRNSVPRFAPEAIEKNQAFVELLKRVATAKQATPAQVALAWLLAQRPYIVPIPGMTKLHRLEENLGAAALTLTRAELDEIGTAATRIEAAGDRYAPQQLAKVGRDPRDLAPRGPRPPPAIGGVLPCAPDRVRHDIGKIPPRDPGSISRAHRIVQIKPSNPAQSDR